MTTTFAAAEADRHPIGLIVEDDLKRNRLTVFFRLLLAIPQLIWLSLWAIVASVAVFFAWIVALFTGRVPDGLHDVPRAVPARERRTSPRTCFLLADPWPPFLGEPAATRSTCASKRAEPQSRLTVFFRLFLAIPALLLCYVFRIVNQIVAFLGWFYCLATGRMHQGMRDISLWMVRYEFQTYGYLLLLTGRYPSFAGAPTA